MGIGIFLKDFTPLTLYLSGWLAAIMAVFGNVRWALMLVAFLLPLRNIIERVQIYPLGNQFIDILLIGTIIGGIVNKKSSKTLGVTEKSGISGIAVVTVVYLLFSVIRGGFYLYGGFHFDIHDAQVQDWKNFSLMPLLFFINFKNNVSKKEIWTLFSVMCLSMFLVDYYTANQIREHSALIGREQIKGTFQFLGPNEVAAFFNEYTIILMSVFYAVKNGRNKFLLLMLILANLYCITFLYSRGAYAGLMLGMFILFAIKDKKLLVPLFLVLLLWQSVLPQNVVDRIKETKTVTGGLDVSSQRRIDIWEQAFGYIKANPVVGIGFGSFRHLGLDLGDTHNIYVKIMTEQGLIGICIFLFTIFVFIKEGWQLYQKGDDELSKAFGLGFFCCVFVMMVNNLFGDRWSYLEPNAYLWIFAGLAARLRIIAQNHQPIKQMAPGKVKSLFQSDPPKMNRKVRYYDPPVHA